MALKKSELYSSLWQSCDALRGGMDASQYKDYVLSLLFIKYISDKYDGQPFAPIIIPEGASFKALVGMKGKPDIGDQINKKVIAPLAAANQQLSQSDFPDFNDAVKLGDGSEKVDRLTQLVSIFEGKSLDFSKNRAEGDDILGDAYEYLMRHFASESGKSKGQFYTPAEVSRIMASILGINKAETSSSTTVYDPTCGSGSLLLKVSDEAETKITLYGQEKDATTSGLARMNMILHDNPTADIKQGNTLAAPKFLDGSTVKTFDYIVANPPFSDKRWMTGLDPNNDPHNRFESFGVPPGKQGDYAYLLHIVRSLKSTGTAACILPHGVLFRGNAEAVIRANLVRKGYIKGIIGLPANLFYGVGIPACIVVIEKSHASERQESSSGGIFMIDASDGFKKDGPKNRLRAQDIHKIVDVFNRQEVIEGYSKLVGYEEIEKNEFNLNLPRYIDNRDAEDIHDIAAHLQGGVPESDLESLGTYWNVCPGLRGSLFLDNRPSYLDLAVEKSEIKNAIYNHPEFRAFIGQMNQHFDDWRKRVSSELREIATGAKPKQIIKDLSEGLLGHYFDRPLISHYDVYQHLMDYWDDVMQDDVYHLVTDGWIAETQRVMAKDKKGKEKDKGWICDLIPKELIVARYFAEEQAAINDLQSNVESLEANLTELEETHGGDDGPLNGVTSKTDATSEWKTTFDAAWEELLGDSFYQHEEAVTTVNDKTEFLANLQTNSHIFALRNAKGNITISSVKKQLQEVEGHVKETLSIYLNCNEEIKAAKSTIKALLSDAELKIREMMYSEFENDTIADLRVIDEYLGILDRIASTKKEIKEAELALDKAAYEKYPMLSKDEIKTLVVDDKWMARLHGDVHSEMDRISQSLTQRVKELAERYEKSLPDLSVIVADLASKVSGHLEQMNLTVHGSQDAEVAK